MTAEKCKTGSRAGGRGRRRRILVTFYPVLDRRSLIGAISGPIDRSVLDPDGQAVLDRL
jgi:hypothetical protein